MNVYRLKNVIQEYQWGSPTYLPQLLGTLNPEGTPMAEMWMGTHPKAPSVAVGEHEAAASRCTVGRQDLEIHG